jgi:hypothetical protein
LEVQICKVVDNFKLDLLVAKKKGDADEIWKIPIVESEIFVILGSSENFKSLEIFDIATILQWSQNF